MRFALVVLVGCGSSAPPPPVTQKPAVIDEGARRAALSAAQNERLDEQATALAAVCEAPQPTPRCLPSCYTPEPADPRAGMRFFAAVEIQHRVCTRTEGVFVLLDEGANLLARRAARFPTANRKGTWQAEVEAAVHVSLAPELGRGDVVRVTGEWKATTIGGEALRCVAVSHFARSLRLPLDACGSTGATVCEASHSDAVHGINVIHYRLLEARRLKSEGNESGCLAAALEASAVARGMPRWRQYMSLNTTKWRPAKRYRTRLDGTLDEDTLFATAIKLGVEAEQVYTSCGASRAATSAKQEQSFHTCW